jgi:hypothetical protein
MVKIWKAEEPITPNNKKYVKVGDLVKRKLEHIDNFRYWIVSKDLKIDAEGLFKIGHLKDDNLTVGLIALDGKKLTTEWDTCCFIRVNKLKEIDFEEYKKKDGYC